MKLRKPVVGILWNYGDPVVVEYFTDIEPLREFVVSHAVELHNELAREWEGGYPPPKIIDTMSLLSAMRLWRWQIEGAGLDQAITLYRVGEQPKRERRW